MGLPAEVASDADSFVLLGSRLDDLLDVIIFVEAQQAIETFGSGLPRLGWLLCLQAQRVEVMTTFEHLNILPDCTIYDEILIAFIACLLSRHDTLQPCLIQHAGVGCHILLDQISSIVQNVLVIGLSLHFLFKSRLKFRICVLLANLLQEVDDLLQLHVFRHSHHKCLYSGEQERLEVIEGSLVKVLEFVFFHDVLFDLVDLIYCVEPELL